MDTARKAAVAGQNQEAADLGKQARHRGGQEGNTNAVHDKPGTNRDMNKKDVKIRFKDEGGNPSTYAMRRLAKDRPNLHAQCLASAPATALRMAYVSR